MGGKDDTMTTGEATLTRAGGATFMGHPKGLFYLAFTEAWERFSFYGMTALVVLYMVNPGVRSVRGRRFSAVVDRRYNNCREPQSRSIVTGLR